MVPGQCRCQGGRAAWRTIPNPYVSAFRKGQQGAHSRVPGGAPALKPAYRVLGLQRVHQTIRGQSASKEELLRMRILDFS